MCGRYILAQQAKFERAIKLQRIHWQFTASYNVAPTQSVPVVRLAEGVWEGVMMRWGLVPFWSRGVPPKFSTINATMEKLTSAPAWRGPWERGRRCIMPAAGFYEWHLAQSGAKQPFFVHLNDRETFGFAALWDRSVKEDGTAIESCAIVTMPGNELLRSVHNTGANPYRMPAILDENAQEAWLAGTPEQARAALRPYPDDLMVAYRVSVRVNTAKNDDPALIEPAADDPASSDS